MIRDYVDTDAEGVLALNEANVPEVGPMDRAKLDLLAGESPCFKVVEMEGDIVGLLIVLTNGSSYGSPNYAWFSERLTSFAYIDRVALAVSARGLGLGPALYDEVANWAHRAGKPVICAEVNTNPPNPRSLRFHKKNGFVVVDHFRPYGGDEEVAMVQKELVV